jgi:hypothetical protein
MIKLSYKRRIYLTTFLGIMKETIILVRAIVLALNKNGTEIAIKK